MKSSIFLYSDYRKSAFYWLVLKICLLIFNRGFLVFFRKFLFISSINLLRFSLYQQALILLLILAIFQMLEFRLKPYYIPELNSYAFFSLNTLIFTIFVKLLATAINGEIDNFIASIFILIINICFYWTFFYKTVKVNKDYMKKLLVSLKILKG